MQLPRTIELKGIRVLTTKQLAECYDSDSETLKNNFAYNRKRFVEGKHYISLEGAELKEFKARYEIHTNLKYARILYLWTEKGALLHAKSLNTDKAWEVYDYLVDFYFRAKEQEKPKTYREIREASLAEKRQQTSASQSEQKELRMVVDIPENAQAQYAIVDIKKALGAVEVMLDESAQYISEENFKMCRDGLSRAFLALLGKITIYMKIKPKLIKR